MTKPTVKLIIEGDPVHVEDIIEMARRHFDVAEEGKTQNIAMRPGVIRRVLRIVPPPAGEERKAA